MDMIYRIKILLFSSAPSEGHPALRYIMSIPVKFSDPQSAIPVDTLLVGV
jgi:hypothetical protein